MRVRRITIVKQTPAATKPLPIVTPTAATAQIVAPVVNPTTVPRDWKLRGLEAEPCYKAEETDIFGIFLGCEAVLDENVSAILEFRLIDEYAVTLGAGFSF